MIIKDVKGVFFDFDNTLVDSASILVEVHRKTAESIAGYLNGLGHRVSLEEIADLIKSVETIMEERLIFDRDLYWKHVLERLGISIIPEEVIIRWTENYWSYYSRARIFDDAIPTLSKLSGRYRLGMITNTDGRPGLKRRRLQGYGLDHFFQVIMIAGDDIPEVKPSPKPFKAAAEALGVGPEESVMVGDHPRNDIEGAKRAGMRAVQITRNRGSVHAGVEPDFVIENLSQLLLVI